MLLITDAGGNDLLASPPVLNIRVTGTARATIAVYATITETDTNLPYQLVGAELDWNDGTQPVAYPGVNAEQPSPLTISATRDLAPGTYAITLVAHNNRAPSADVYRITFPWTIVASSQAGVTRKVLFGPILPNDDGVPNAANWSFDTGSDSAVLRSSLKMLLLTAKGERLMLPAYGTNLRRILFELNLASVETLVQQEISQAVAQYEPRVALQGLEVTRDPNTRSVAVNAQFISKLNSQVFDLELQYRP